MLCASAVTKSVSTRIMQTSTEVLLLVVCNVSTAVV